MNRITEHLIIRDLANKFDGLDNSLKIYHAGMIWGIEAVRGAGGDGTESQDEYKNKICDWLLSIYQ